MGVKGKYSTNEAGELLFLQKLDDLSFSFRAFVEVFKGRCQSFLTASLRVYFYSTLRPKCVNMK